MYRGAGTPREQYALRESAMSFRVVDRARSGLNLAEARQNAFAHNTANALTEGHRRVRVDGAEGPDGGVEVRVSREALPGPDLVRDVVESATTAVLYRANIAVVNAESERLGELLDLQG